jgi:GR25 family glycosyltransferase involved in LPS biosynthesis
MYNLLEGVDIIYWINLDRSKERRKKMKEMLQNPPFQSIPNKRISGFDPLIEKEKIEKYIHTNFLRMSYPEYACLLSQLNTIKKFSNSKNEIALILEDDVYLKYGEYWNKTINDLISKAPKDWDIIQLTQRPDIKVSKLFQKWQVKWEYQNNSYRSDKLKNIANWGADAYLINKKGAKKLMHQLCEKNNKYNLPDDIPHFADLLIFYLLNTYIYKYPLFSFHYDLMSNIKPLSDCKLSNALRTKKRKYYNNLEKRKDKQLFLRKKTRKKR